MTQNSSAIHSGAQSTQLVHQQWSRQDFAAAKEPAVIVVPKTMLHQGRVLLTGIALNNNVAKLDVQIATEAATTVEKVAKSKQPDWSPSPSPITDLGTLTNHYLMLSKARLTCE